MKLWHEEGGQGSPTLVLLHGLGATADVWAGLKPFLGEWPGRWLAPDLRGHGRSPHEAPYGYAVHAADVAELLAQDEEVVLLGHSMGGVVAMALASGWFGVRVRQVLAFGVKIRWAEGEAQKVQALARAPTREFERREEAIERYLKVSGLFGLADPAGPLAASGVREQGGRFRLAADPRINAVVGPEIAALAAAMTCPLRLAAGSRDPMTSLEHMRPFDPEPFIFEGAGHNVHVERPEALWSFVRSSLR
jgi:pimeloyl-ACP methyl ester carboxylesterase